jgi:uncharacterized protein involved in outer membrane biogenesis
LLSIGQTQWSGAALANRQVQTGSLTLQSPSLNLTRGANGDINLLALFKARTVAKSQTLSGSAWRIPPPQLKFNDGKVSWIDHRLTRPVSLSLDQLAGSLTPRAGSSLFDAVLSGNAGKGRFTLSGALDASADSVTGQISAQGLPLVPLAPYVLSGTILSLSKGNTSAKLDLMASPKGWSLAGQASIDNLAIMEPGETEPLLGWHSLNLAGLKLAGNPLSLSVRNMLVDQPIARLVLDQHRVSNIRQLFSSSPPGAAPSSRHATPTFNVRVVHVRNAAVDFTDQGLNPAFSAQVNHLTGSITGLSSRPGQRGTLALNGDVDQGGDVRVRGVLAPLDITDNADVTLMFRNIALTSLNTYSENIAGWQINDGRLSVGLHYVLSHRQIQGENSIVVDSIQLGPQVERPGISRLPLSLAVMLLEDSDGRIELHLPVSGNLDDPKFSYGGLVWQAFVNVIEKAVTAPFRALGSLLGIQGFDDVRFVAGEAAVTAPEREKLQQLSQMLAKRPQLKLSLAGTYDPLADRKQLARARIDRAIITAAGISLAADEPLPEIDMQDPAMQLAVKTMFAQRIGHLKLLARMVTGASGPGFYAALRQEAINAEPITDAELIALATARAHSAQQFLLQASPDMSSRITLEKVHTAQASADGIPLDIELLGH